MTDLRDVVGSIDHAKLPPPWRRWMATSVGNGRSLANVSFPGALRYCVVELLRGNGPCYYERMRLR